VSDAMITLAMGIAAGFVGGVTFTLFLGWRE